MSRVYWEHYGWIVAATWVVYENSLFRWVYYKFMTVRVLQLHSALIGTHAQIIINIIESCLV